MKEKRQKFRAVLLLALSVIILWSCSGKDDSTNESSFDGLLVGISWRSDVDSEFLTNIEATLNNIGVKYVLLDEAVDSLLPYSNGNVDTSCIDGNDVLKQQYADIVKNQTYSHSNVTYAIKNVDAVIFTGGEDIAPTLYKTPQPWHGIEAEKDYNATRDVNDYLLMTYCLDKEIPIVGFCRGSQMLGVVSGATVIQDIPTWFQEKGLPYNYEHRNEKATPTSYRDYAPHDVNFTDGSKLAALFGCTTLKGCPSWHHQAIESIDGTKLKVTGTTTVSGVAMVEGIERTDKRLAIGLQFHPEAACVKYFNNVPNASNYMSKDQAIGFFKNFLLAVKNAK